MIISKIIGFPNEIFIYFYYFYIIYEIIYNTWNYKFINYNWYFIIPLILNIMSRCQENIKINYDAIMKSIKI
jgi:hypothetical protein